MITIKAERNSNKNKNNTIATKTIPDKRADVIVLTALCVISVLS